VAWCVGTIFMVCRQTGTKENEKNERGGGMKASFPSPIRSAAHGLLGLPARVSCTLALAGLVAACAQPEPTYYYYAPPQAYGYPTTSNADYRLYNVRPAPDDSDTVISAPAPSEPAPPAPAPSTSRQSILSPVSPAEAAEPAPAPQASVPAPPPADPSSRSPTCGYWRLGCGILWQ